MARRFTGLLAVSLSAVVGLSAAACTSDGGSSGKASAAASSTASLSIQQVTVLFLQCLIDHDATIWDRAQGDTNLRSLAEKAGWYADGRVVPSDEFWANFDSLEGFYPIGPDFKPQQTIADWTTVAMLHRTWPKVCAPLP